MRRIIILLLIGCMTVFMVGCSGGFNYELKEHYNSREEVLEEMEELSNEYWYGSDYPYDDQAFERYMAMRKTLEDLLEGEFALPDGERKLQILNDAVKRCDFSLPDEPKHEYYLKALQIKSEVEAGTRNIDEALEILYYDFPESWDKITDPWLYDKLFGETGPTRPQDYEGWKKY